MSFIAITNNSVFRDKYEGKFDISFADVPLHDIFILVRDKVHAGHEILSHPLSGSVKPGETPYKTVFIAGKKGSLNMDSLALIENAIMTCSKFEDRKYDYEKKIEDFQLIDLSLAESALAGIRGY